MKNPKLYRLIFEQEEAPPPSSNLKDPPEGNVKFKGNPGARKSSDSVDDQIDSLILMYEQKSIRDEEDKLFESIFKKSLKMLLEQEEPIEDEPAADDTAADATTTDSPTGSETAGDVPPANKDLVPDLDVDAYTRRVARLVMNHRNLLRIEDVIINRAKNFLDENYGDAFVSKYLEDLENKYGIEISELPEDEEEIDAPFAIGANPAGAGMSGGG